ncbi:hypothetical protein [Mangrovibrevibacter kandeliae]|uniref:hypothetical protein n=1 Tax=Mangrovibrevibacter kandeliae TaxID=2968473 RepID=UPI002119547E|nr:MULTISPECIES: hypothetical protein [unclassified Aurantimonas]MCQ8784196.1 hypothetical protein [Aurantimonas sp. CSK15Z-1]MCW4116962.1 hypothetical protein [Aurantimonas sp. MSK8Z-1]
MIPDILIFLSCYSGRLSNAARTATLWHPRRGLRLRSAGARKSELVEDRCERTHDDPQRRIA